MPLITGTVYLFGQILSFALPVGLLITFATFFYRQARKMPKNASVPPSTPNVPEPPAAPSQPYSAQ